MSGDPDQRPPLNIAQVGRELGHSAEWFSRHRAKLEAEQGFPPPMPGCGKRWDSAAVARWKDHVMPQHLRDQPAGDDGELAAARAELERRLNPGQAQGLRLVADNGRMGG